MQEHLLEAGEKLKRKVSGVVKWNEEQSRRNDALGQL